MPGLLRRSGDACANLGGKYTIVRATESGHRCNMNNLAAQFDQAMLTIYRRAKSEAGYDARIFLGMVMDRGRLGTAKYLINSSKPSDGYSALYERGRLDLTVEAMLVEESRWHSLFTSEELAEARARLKAYHYSRPPTAGPT